MDATEKPSYSLEDLSAHTGFDTRVIRSFIEQGLLPGPNSLGRYARYSDWHLVRLLAIKTLKERRGLKLSDIRQMLLGMSEAELRALADIAKEPQTDKPISSALDYIRSLNQETFSSQKQYSSPSELTSPNPPTTNLLVTNANSPITPQVSNTTPPDSRGGPPAQQIHRQQPVTQSQRQLPVTETWHRFQITPDVELSVRGIQTEQQLARLQSIANYLREILIGGQNE